MLFDPTGCHKYISAQDHKKPYDMLTVQQQVHELI